MNLDDYIDLTDQSLKLEDYKIVANNYVCDLISIETGQKYKGFYLGKSPAGEAFTLCDVEFQWSRTDSKYPARLTFRRVNKKGEDKVVPGDRLVQRISFDSGEDGYREFWKMVAFLSKFNEVVDTSKIFSEFQVASRESVVEQLKAKEIDARKAEIIEYIEKSNITLGEMADVINLRARKQDMSTFKNLLDNKNNDIEAYRTEFAQEIKGAGEEAVWHHFLSNHKWIFGLSLDLRFMENFTDEATVGEPNTANQGNPKADMLGWNDFTVTVELKTPRALFFTPEKTSEARANTWSFTTTFIEGFSQVLAQGDDWNVKGGSGADIVYQEQGVQYELNNGVIRTIDPQAIFIYGNKQNELPKESSEVNIRTKRDTLERLARNNRNVTIISFDELYERAFHIVYGDTAQDSTEP
jgi:hypothetical protein